MVQYFSAASRIIFLFLIWGALNGANNVTTIYFNAHTQQRLNRSERGKFIANILTLFTLANSAGSMMYGWALSSDSVDVQIAMAAKILFIAVIARMVVVVVFHSSSGIRDDLVLPKIRGETSKENIVLPKKTS